MQPRLKARVTTVAEDLAKAIYQDFKDNPQYQGPKFTWEKFPKMASRIVKTSLFMYFKDGQIDEQAEQLAEQIALKVTTQLVANDIGK